jgi:cell division protein FtsB
MGGGKRSIGLIRRMLWPALALLVVGNFAGNAIAGPNGLLAWGGYHRDLNERKVELAKLKEQKAKLQHRSKLLDPNKADPDMADELVRRDLGLIRNDEIVVPLN